MTIPEKPAEYAEWLEKVLVNGEMADLVSELEAVHGKRSKLVSLTNVCGDKLPEIYEGGLKVLGPPAVSKLLENPHLLLALTADVMEYGGAYWDKRLNSDKTRDRNLESSWEKLQAAIRQEDPVFPIRQEENVFPIAEVVNVKPVRRKRLLSAWFVVPITSFATAASVIIGILFIPGLRERIAPLPYKPSPKSPLGGAG